MKLTDLNPSWWRTGGEGITSSATGELIPERHGEGLNFDCPCGCGRRHSIPFKNPIDGQPPNQAYANAWVRTGDTFDTLSLTPSILDKGSCGWHGFIGSNGAAPGYVITV